MKKVFISHPYADDPEENKKRVDKICKKIIAENDDILPISPLHLWSFMDGDGGYRKNIIDFCYRLIDNCDEVWFYYTGPAGNCYNRLSEGQKKELHEAIYKEKAIKFIEAN